MVFNQTSVCVYIYIYIYNLTLGSILNIEHCIDDFNVSLVFVCVYIYIKPSSMVSNQT